MSAAKRRRHAGARQAKVAELQVAPVVEEACVDINHVFGPNSDTTSL